MQEKKFYAPLRLLSYGVLLLMAAAIGYAFIITLVYWTGIGV